VSRNDIIAESDNSKLLAAGRAGRERARPLECNYTKRCYVDIGAAGLLNQNMKRDICAACGGRLYDYCHNYGPTG
jgi:hypothetical protein